MQIIKTRRLTLRPFLKSDLSDYFLIMKNPNVTKYLSDGRERSHKDIVITLDNILEHWKTKDYGIWAVFDNKTQKLLGHCGFMFYEKNNKVEFLYAYNENVWGKGIATEAGKSALDFAKTNYNFPDIIAMAYPDNIASINVLLKLGFSYISLEKHFGHDINIYTLK